jgi:hypothetical protein
MPVLPEDQSTTIQRGEGLVSTRVFYFLSLLISIKERILFDLHPALSNSFEFLLCRSPPTLLNHLANAWS